MTDLGNTIDTELTTVKADAVKAETAAISTWDAIKAAYVTGWPYWAPAIVLTAVLGHYV